MSTLLNQQLSVLISDQKNIKKRFTKKLISFKLILLINGEGFADYVHRHHIKYINRKLVRFKLLKLGEDYKQLQS